MRGPVGRFVIGWGLGASFRYRFYGCGSWFTNHAQGCPFHSSSPNDGEREFSINQRHSFSFFLPIFFGGVLDKLNAGIRFRGFGDFLPQSARKLQEPR